MGSLRDFFLRLGLKTDAAGFAEGMATVNLLQKGLEVVAEIANKTVEVLKEQVTATVEAGVEAKRMGTILGVSSQTFQKLAYSANMSEVSTEALTAATRKLAMEGVKDTTGYLLKMADRIAAMPEGAGRATVAINAFGRSGREMLPWLSKGSAAIRQMMEDADDLGIVMGEDTITETEDYERAQKRLGFTLQGLRNTIVRELLPALTHQLETLQRIIKAFLEWYKAPHEKMIGWLKLIAIGLLAVAAAMAIAAAATALEGVTIGGLILELAGLVDGLVAATVAAWGWTVAQAAALWPVTLLAVALGALYLALNDFVVFMNGGDSLIGDALKKWIGPFTDWRDAVHKVIEEIKADIVGFFSHPLDFKKQSDLSGDQAWKQDTPIQKWIREKIPIFGSAEPVTAGQIIGGGAESPRAASLNYSPSDFTPGPASASASTSSVQTIVHRNETTIKVEVGEQGVKKLINGHAEEQYRAAAAATGG